MRNFLQSLSECHPQTSMSNVLEIDCCLEGILTIAITVYQKSYRDMYYQRHHTCSKYCIQFSCSKLCILHYCIRQIMAHLTPEIIRAYCSNKQLMVFGLRKSQILKAKVIQRFDCLYFFLLRFFLVRHNKLGLATVLDRHKNHKSSDCNSWLLV